jgi:hypothetical protein
MEKMRQFVPTKTSHLDERASKITKTQKISKMKVGPNG